MSRIRQFLRSPIFEDEEKSRIAGLLYPISLSLLAVLVLTAASSVLMGYLETAWVLAAGALGPLGSLWLTRRGHLRAAGLLGLLTFLGILDCLLYIGDGIHDIAIIAYPAVIVIGGLLLGRRTFVVYTLLVVLSLQGIILGELSGLIVNRLSEFISPSDLVYVSVSLFITAVGSRLLADSIARSIAKARSAQRALQESNRELRREIAERVRAESEVRRRTEGLLAVNELAVRCATAPVEVNLWGLIAEELRAITGALAIGVSTYDPTARELEVRHIAIQGQFLSQINKLLGRNVVGMRMPVQPDVLKRMLSEVVTTEDDLSEVTFGAIPRPVAAAIVRALGIETFMGLAFHYGGELVGTAVIVVRKGQPKILMDVAQTFASVAAVSLRRKQAEEALEQRNDELELLNKAGRAFNSTLDLDEVLVTVLDEVRQMLGVIACSAWLVDRDTGNLVCRQAASPQSAVLRGWNLAAGQGIAGWVAQHDRSEIVPDVQADPRYFRGIDERTGLWLNSILAVPLRVKDEVIGVLEVVDDKPNRFTAGDLALVESLALTAAAAIENARLYEQTRRDAEIKAALLDEVNHRVKNNLMSIMGLIAMEKQHPLDDGADLGSVLGGLQHRIRGLITVHELLSAAQWSPLSLVTLVREVIQAALQGSPISHKIEVTVTTEAEGGAVWERPILVAPRQATGLTLILNELTTNSAKHAFSGRDRGRIEVCITVASDCSKVALQFRDDGPGWSDTVLHGNDETVGLSIVRGTVHSALGGRLTLSNDRGALATIAFRLAPVGQGEAFVQDRREQGESGRSTW